MAMKMPEHGNHSFNHGFYVLGEGATLLSHIPMFMAPHNAQLFLEVRLSAENGTDPAQAIEEDRRNTGADKYVLVTDPLVLPNLGPDARKPLRSFKGKVYRGWPFDDLANAPVAVPAVTVDVVRPVQYRSLVGAKPLPRLKYRLFRTPQGEYLAHVISEPPDFDQILAVDESAQDGRSERTVDLEFPDLANTIANKLAPKSQVNAVIAGTKTQVRIRTGAELIYDAEHLAKAM